MAFPDVSRAQDNCDVKCNHGLSTLSRDTQGSLLCLISMATVATIKNKMLAATSCLSLEGTSHCGHEFSPCGTGKEAMCPCLLFLRSSTHAMKHFLNRSKKCVLPTDHHATSTGIRVCVNAFTLYPTHAMQSDVTETSCHCHEAYDL